MTGPNSAPKSPIPVYVAHPDVYSARLNSAELTGGWMLPGSGTDILWDGSDIAVKFVPGGTGDRARLVVTFDCVRDRSDGLMTGFGEQFFQSRGIDAVHVIAKADHWFQTPEIDAVTERVRALASHYAKVFAYGSSMGGFGALQYGGRMGAGAAIAMSPQFSNDPRMPPFDRRWRKSAGRFASFDLPEPAAGFAGTSYIFYDPRDHDARHAELLGLQVRACLVEVPFAGHPCTHLLAETGLLSGTVMAILDDRFDAGTFRSALREARSTVSRHMFQLAERARSERLREYLIFRAIEAAKDRPAAIDAAIACRATAQARRKPRSRLKSWLRHPRKLMIREVAKISGA
jgi:hypothetical protein